MKELKYSEILRLNSCLAGEVKGKKLTVKILSNIMVSQLKEIGECFLRSSGVNADFVLGNYDNIVQDAQDLSESDIVVIFWEAANLIDCFHYKSNRMSEAELKSVIDKTISEIDLVIGSLKNKSMVLMNRFSTAAFNVGYLEGNSFDKSCDVLNDYIESHLPRNMRIINIDRIISGLSVRESVDMRFYYSSKSLYSIEFLKEYAIRSFSYILSAQGKARKALIFDCDNTIWGGVLGEDGYDHIQVSNDTAGGSVFQEIQYIASELRHKGVIIGLCSKNNLSDVNEVIGNHPHMVLRENDITIKKINWDDKASNLKAIAKELNIGLDSLVFIDDSEFEISLVNELLPDVLTIQVPKKLADYPGILRNAAHLFLNESQTKEDRDRTQIYKNDIQRKEELQEFQGIEDYLRSLDLQLAIHVDDKSIIPRASQLTQKTNQFNLTTIRYTHSDISRFMGSSDHLVFTFELSDKFGSSGTTGLAIVELESSSMKARMDTFLMSCRVIGRNVEYNFFQFIAEYLERRGVKELEACYVQTLKNDQVKDFFIKCGCALTKESDKERHFRLSLDQSHDIGFDYIGVTSGRPS